MKFFTFVKSLILAISICQFAIAQEITFSAPWSQAGISLMDQSPSGVSVNMSLHKMFVEDLEYNKEVMKNISIPEVFLPNETGAPNLPSLSRFIAIPQGSSVVLTIKSYRTEVMTGIDLAPAPNIPLDNDNNPQTFEKDMQIYGKNANYPSEIAATSEVTQIRGVDVVMLRITPYQYNPVTKELIIYRDVKVDIEFKGGNGQFGENRLRSRWWDPILEDALLNYSSLPVIDYNNQLKDAKDGYEYLIIVPTNAEFAQWADSLRKFRNEQGILTGVVNLTTVGGNTVTAIENYVNNAYNSWSIPPAAVLLLGDYGTSATNSIISHLYSHPAGYPSFASDNKYADVNNNEMPDMAFSRIAANNSSQLQVMISKVLNYERNPPTDLNFYKYPITALGWQTERWFQICSEVVGGFWKNTMGKLPVRVNAIYSGTPGSVWSTATNTTTVVNYFGPNGLNYIPAAPSALGGWSGGTATHVNNAINNGAFMVMHRDHGYYQGWGEPAYSTSNVNSLNNVNNRLPFILTINCQTGAYHNPSNNSDILLEKFHRYTFNGQNSGALGLLGPTEVSYSFVNDTYVWGVMDNMWPQFMPAQGTTPPSRDVRPAFGNCGGKYFLQSSAWPYNTSDKLVTYRLFHHHGDAFMWVYSEVPQALTVVHDATLAADATTFAVTANAGSFIALTVNGNIIGTANGTGSPVIINIPAQPAGSVVKVVVTKQNYFRYSSNVSVIDAGVYNVNLKVFLEGPFSGTLMNKFLNIYGFLPLSQPYSAAPWYYAGTESVTSIPSPEIVDWILVEFRDAASAQAATSSTVIEREAAFLMSDGTVKAMDGTTAIKINTEVTQNLFVVIKQRNHLGIISANPLVLSGGAYSYDFTTAASQAYNNNLGYKQLVTGTWGMMSGDGDSDGTIGNGDKIEVWRPQTGQSGYLKADFNLSGFVDNTDRITYWQPNAGKSSQVPL